MPVLTSQTVESREPRAYLLQDVQPDRNPPASMFDLGDLRGRPNSRKRRRDAAAEQLSDRLPAGKRQKQTKEPRHHRSPRFWDHLSKVPLCRASLKEFDRRVLVPGPPPSTSDKRDPTTKSKAEELQRTTSVSILDEKLPNQAASDLAEPQSAPTVLLSSAHLPRPQRLKRFARHGGPDLTHLRGFGSHHLSGRMSQSSSSRKRSSASGRSTTSKTRSSADPAFEQNMIDAGIYPADYDPDDGQSVGDPANMDDIQAALRVCRPSLSPSRFSDRAFKDFKKTTARANGETSARTDVISIIQGDGRKQYRHGADHVFNHLEPLDEELPKPKPDHYDGALPESIDRRVRRDLGKYIVPCTDTSRPAVPNFILEAKGNGGRADVLKRQACHHGALGARAVHQLENYQAAEPQYDRHAKSFSSTYHHGTSTLALYSHHMTQPKVPEGRPEYHMTQLRSFSMNDTPKSFREGAGALRNLRDLSQTHRNSAIDHANQVARHAPADSPSTLLTDSRASLSVVQDNTSDTSADETHDEHTTAKRSRHDAPVHPRASRVTATPVSLTSSRSGHDADTLVPLSQSDTRKHGAPPNSGSRHSSVVEEKSSSRHAR